MWTVQIDRRGERIALRAKAETPMLREVNLTSAPNLSPLFDEAVRQEQPVLIVRGGRERGVLLSRERQLRALAPFRFQVDVIPEEEGGFTLRLRELNIGQYGATLAEARAVLLDGVRSYVLCFYQRWDFFHHLRDQVAQEPYVYRLSLAKDDGELITMLFGAEEGSAGPTPEVDRGTSRAG